MIANEPIEYTSFPGTTFSANGLTASDAGNANYASFSSPSATTGGQDTVPLVLQGTQAAPPLPAPVPEPTSLGALPTGLALTGWVLRKRRS